MKDIKDICLHFKELFYWGKNLSKEGLNQCTQSLKILPLHVMAPQNISSTWKALLVGRA